MGSIIKKKIKGINYYYYTESKRIDGKPKLVNQKYLGTADRLLEKIASAESSLQDRILYSDESDFAAPVLLFDIASRIGIVGMIDELIPKRKQGASTGMYILTATINRAVAPSATSGLEKWYSGTCLPLLTGIKPSAFTPQNFWNNTCISMKEISACEDSILKKIINSYDIDTSHLIYDATNFFTYIDTNQECETAKRGHSKEKRNDLRIIGLSLMVSQDCNIPLLHETYPGNTHDATQFHRMMKQLKERYEFITKKESDTTIVFDRGNNSEENISFLESGDFPLHYIGGLRKNQASELYEIPLSDYTPLIGESLKNQTAYRTEVDVFGRRVTAVIVYNPELEKGQLQGIGINREKIAAKLLALQQGLMRRAKGETVKGRKPSIESVKKNVEAIVSVEYMTDIFSYQIFEQDGNIYLNFAFSDEALEKIRKEQLGRNALFTDRRDMSNEEIVTAYRSAWHVEAAFKQMKDTNHLTVRPVFHWTDEKIRVHLFTCVLAYRLCCLLVKELSDNGINITVNKMLDELSSIKKINTFFGNVNKPEKVESFTLGSELAQQIESIYRLKQTYS
jgi:transposase